MGKCPKCETSISRFKLELTKAQRLGSPNLWHCWAFCCPSCETVVSVQVDPTALRDEIVDEIKAALRRS